MAGPDRVLPSFFVIGAPKCGTTSIHHYLSQHPEISMSRVKEPYVFAGPDYESRLPEYAGILDGAAPARGESSAVYSMHPHFPDVPERISRVVPAARFIYLVGDPVARAVSHYLQRVTDGAERDSLAVALLRRGEGNVYVTAGSYASQLERYLTVFAADRLLVLDQDSLRDRTAETLREAFDFLGVDPSFRSDVFEARLNTREEHRARTPLGRTLAGSQPFELTRRLPIPAALRDRLRAVSSRPVGRPELSPRIRTALEERLRPEAARLRELTGRPFAGWSV